MAEPAAPARSQALDDLIMGTNSSSIVSKRSVERLYYPDEPHFFRYFVKKFQRRAPLINRGYWLRLRAIDVIVSRFLTDSSSGRKKVIINLGCGSDVLPWQCHTRHPDACQNAIFVDVDYPDLMRKKRAIVLQTPQLQELLGTDFCASESDQEHLLLRSDKYCQIGCDLRELESLKHCLDSFLTLSQCDVLFVAEVSITYMDTVFADSLIQWASSIGHAEFCLLEQILPHGGDHPFAQTMLKHFNKLNTPPKSVFVYPTIESQRCRFQERGWATVQISDLWQAWTEGQFVSSSERASLDNVEPFDEWEEFVLFARHYFVLHAFAASTTTKQDSLRADPPTQDYNSPVKLKLTSYNAPKSVRRRFGSAMTVSNSLGQKFLLNMMGSDTSGRSDTYDVYSLGPAGTPTSLPLTGPLARMCFTLTDLGDVGVLLTGGRGSPANALSDCWLFEKGLHPRWRPAARLPVPLFRHSATRLGNSSLALVVGGKTTASNISTTCLLFDPARGWLSCLVSGPCPEPTFGAVLCNFAAPAAPMYEFSGLLAGGINQSGTIVADKYLWQINIAGTQPVISFQKIENSNSEQDSLSVFGAVSLDFGQHSIVCGGVGRDAASQGQNIVVVKAADKGYNATTALSGVSPLERPFMIGSSLVANKDGFIIVGGGATCFSMGTFWETRLYQVEQSGDFSTQSQAAAEFEQQELDVKYVELRRVVAPNQAELPVSTAQSPEVIPIPIPRVTLKSEGEFREILQQRKPVIVESLQLGECIQKWTPEYMVEKVGQEQEVVVHECKNDAESMDFNSKNFHYVTETFSNMMSRIQAEGKLYLRSLSREKPKDAPANIYDDFPQLAEDFKLPEELDFVKKNLFSSVLRVSGKVNMWLHYDVMANVYVQISGSKRMILFPPDDVSSLSFAPGSSSSSLDVFSALEASTLTRAHPHEANLVPGDVLLLPALWPHTSSPMTDMSIAVNVFFRDLESGYAAGRDVYGNRDLAVYEKGRQDAARISKSFQQLPVDARRFYLARIADELRQAAEGGE